MRAAARASVSGHAACEQARSGQRQPGPGGQRRGADAGLPLLLRLVRAHPPRQQPPLVVEDAYLFAHVVAVGHPVQALEQLERARVGRQRLPACQLSGTRASRRGLPGGQVARRQFDQAILAQPDQPVRGQILEQRLVLQAGARRRRHRVAAGTQPRRHGRPARRQRGDQRAAGLARALAVQLDDQFAGAGTGAAGAPLQPQCRVGPHQPAVAPQGAGAGIAGPARAGAAPRHLQRGAEIGGGEPADHHLRHGLRRRPGQCDIAQRQRAARSLAGRDQPRHIGELVADPQRQQTRPRSLQHLAAQVHAHRRGGVHAGRYHDGGVALRNQCHGRAGRHHKGGAGNGRLQRVDRGWQARAGAGVNGGGAQLARMHGNHGGAAEPGQHSARGEASGGVHAARTHAGAQVALPAPLPPARCHGPHGRTDPAHRCLPGWGRVAACPALAEGGENSGARYLRSSPHFAGRSAKWALRRKALAAPGPLAYSNHIDTPPGKDIV
jgi:hypothetical protein